MRRYELSDQEWAAVEPLLPPPARTGRPRRPVREGWNAIFWMLRSGAPFRDLPERYGPWQTVYHYFNSWRRQGVFDRVLEALQIRLDAEGHIDWDLWCVDGSSVRAAKAAAGAGKKASMKRDWASRLEYLLGADFNPRRDSCSGSESTITSGTRTSRSWTIREAY